MALPVIMVGMAVSATGCMDAVVEMVIDEDGSGTQRVDLRVHRRFLEFMAETAAFSFVEESEVDTVDGIAAEVFTAPGLAQVCSSVLSSDSPVTRMSERASQLGAAVAFDIGSDADMCQATMRVDWDSDAAEMVRGLSASLGARSALRRLPDGGWRFESDTNFAGEEWTGETLFYLGLLDERGIPRPTLELTVALPGTPGAYNASPTTGSTFTWRIRDVFEPEPRIFAETTLPPEESSPWFWLIVIGVVVALPVAALLPWWYRRVPRVLLDNLSPGPPDQARTTRSGRRSRAPGRPSGQAAGEGPV